ncbi:MAG TPA: oligosaccharide flippase family protein [Acidimicrobiales bacterium]|nr:oligosaccharide flippase family protein [Acidimicrobiales bacterium]
MRTLLVRTGGRQGPGGPRYEDEQGTVTSAPARALVANTAAMVGARYVVAALGWAGTLLIVRHLSVEQWGAFSFVFSLLGLLAVFTELGLGRVAIKGLLDDERDPTSFAGTLVVLRGLLGVLAYLVALGFVIVAGYPGEVTRATAVAGLVVVLATPSHAVEGVFQAHLQMGTVAVGNILGQLAQIALVVALVTVGGSVVLLTVPAVACEVVILAWKVRRVRRLQSIRLNVDLSAWWELLKEAAPLAAGVVLATLYFRVDAIMLSKLDDFTAVGIYGVAYKFVELVHYLPTAMMVPLLALLVRAWPDDLETFGDTFRRALTLLVVVGVLIAVEFSVFAQPAIALFYGSEYAVGAPAARLVVAAECLSALGRLAFTVLVATGRYRLYPLAALVGLATNVGLNLWLIPAHSYEGAALATVVTEMLVVAVVLVPVARMDALRPLPVGTVASAVGAGVLCAAVALLAQAWVPWPVAGLLSAFAYLAVVHVIHSRRGGGGLHRLLSAPARS